MAELVNGDVLGEEHAAQGRQAELDGGAEGDEGGVLHPLGAAGAERRVDHRQVVVGVGAEAQAVAGDRRLGGPQVTVLLRRVGGREVEVDRRLGEGDRRRLGAELAGDPLGQAGGDVAGGVEGVLDDDEAGVGGPGEVVHPALDEAHRHLAFRERLRQLAHLDAATGGGDLAGVAAGQDEGDVVVAEVGVELAVGVELVGVPPRLGAAAHAGVLEDRDLREPLTAERRSRRGRRCGRRCSAAATRIRCPGSPNRRAGAARGAGSGPPCGRRRCRRRGR